MQSADHLVKLHRACPNCNHDNGSTPSLLISPLEWPLKECVSCRFTYLSAVPKQEAFFEDLAWDKTFFEEQDRRLGERGKRKKLSRRVRSLLLPYRPDVDALLRKYAKPGRALDVGVSNGKYLLRLTDSFVPFGVEIGKAAAEATNQVFQRYGGRVLHGPALEGLAEFPESFFSGIILRSYLEHEYRPSEVLAAVRRVIEPGGVAIIKVPNYGSLNRKVFGKSWCGFRFPDHVNYFTRRSLTQMLERNGLVAEFLWFKSLPTSDNMTCVARRGA